jgi:IS30 family transposase
MRRCGMSDEQIAELWQRRQRGEPYSMIGQALGRDPGIIHYIVRETGGVPRYQRRAARTLSRREREEISRGLAAQWSLAAIARRLARPTSTVSREVGRHGGRAQYRAAAADHRAWRRARRPKPCRLATHRRLRHVVAALLARRWSPQQIAGWLRVTYPDNPEMQVSHETIYLSLFVQSRGVLKSELVRHLRRARAIRRPRTRPRAPLTHPRIAEAVSIRQRPAAIEDRAVPGHWEGDLLLGGHQSQIATLVERHSRYVLLVRLPRRDSASVVQALARRIRMLPAHLRQTLTWDRGTELAAHRAFTVATDVRVYFCDPQSPWQRGSNENTNGLLRQYFPKGADLRALHQRQLDAIARQLNTRPRKTLGYQTPAAKLAACVASTA